MKGIKEIEHWRAEEIAKVFLLNSGLVTLLPNYSSTSEFLAVSKNIPDRKIAVEVKATKYPRNDIKRVFTKARRKSAQSTLPVILMYIDYDKENGYFEVFQKNSRQRREIEPLVSDRLKEKITELIG